MLDHGIGPIEAATRPVRTQGVRWQISRQESALREMASDEHRIGLRPGASPEQLNGDQAVEGPALDRPRRA